MKKLIASVCVVGFVAAGLSGCSWLGRSDVVVSEDEFRITEDTLFATQLSPIYQEMDTAPGINTSYLVTFDRDGSVQALKIHPMAIGEPIWQGDTLVAVDRKFDYFVTDKVLKIDHPKVEVMTNIVASSTTDEVFALMNDGATEDGYRSVTETITPQGYTTTNLDGAYLMTSECDGVLYGIGDAEGRVAAQAPKELGDHVTALVQASGTANHQEHVISYTKGLFNEGGSSPLPCFADSIVNLILDEAHRYIRKDKEYILKENLFERVAREGRKFACYLFISSQRPSELSPTVLSQCANYIIHRTQNKIDLDYIYSVLPYFSEDYLIKIKQASPGEALVFGSCVPMPLQVEVIKADPEPNSKNCIISEEWWPPKDLKESS